MKNNSIGQKGIAHLGLVLLVIFLAAIGGVGWKVYGTQKKNDSKTPTQTASTSQSTSATKTYRDEVAHFSVDYPKDWTIKTDVTTFGDSGEKTTTTTISSPNGTTLNLGVNYGGKGGDCQPAPTDTPHGLHNQCPTLEWLSKDAIAQQTYLGYENAGKKQPIYLATSKFTSAPNGGTSTVNTTYLIGLITEDGMSGPIKLNTPQIGFFININEFAVYSADKGELRYYVQAYAEGDSADFLTNDEGQAVKNILKSFKFEAK